MIDWDFIAAREGGQMLHGYVPDAGHSGVTIATGIDLGQYSAVDCARLPAPLPAILSRYLTLTGADARAMLHRFPLAVTKEQADAIEGPKRRELMGALSLEFVRDAHVPFESQPDAVQTVMASVTWQYGTPWRRCPHFWAACCARDWSLVIHELRHFGDAYGPRRNLEADYLERGLRPAQP